MRRDLFRNLDWLNEQPVKAKGPHGVLAYENPGVRVWFKDHDVTKEMYHSEDKTWKVCETFKGVFKKELVAKFAGQTRKPKSPIVNKRKA